MKLFIAQLCEIIMVSIEEFGFLKRETWIVRVIYNIRKQIKKL
jgi:hypothetical protein